MLLNILKRRVVRAHGDESGAALAAVMGLMMVGMLLTTLILTSVVTSLGTTTSTRAGVQSEASAQAGVDVALASLITGTSCASTYTTTTAPIYSARLSYTTAATLTTTGLTWTAGCPSASATFVKVTSAGTAAALGTSGNKTGDSRTIEAIYTRPVSSAVILATGPAVYAYSSQSFGGSGTLVSQDGTNDANVMVRTGDVSCSGGAAASGDLVVNNGNLTLSGSCGVAGSAWASGAGKGQVALSGGVSVGGNIVANSLTVNSGSIGGSVWTSGSTSMSSGTVTGGVSVTGNSFTSGGSNTIGGSLWSSGGSTITNGDWIKGNATAQTLNLTGGNVGTTTSNEAWSRGAVTGVTWYSIKAHMTAQSVPNGMTAQGGITLVPAGPGAGTPVTATPIAPTVPAWVNFAYNQSDWTGFSQATMGSTCDWTALQTAINGFSGGKGVIDARACSGAITISSYQKLTMSNDLAIISTKGFTFAGSSGFISSAPHNLWLITPDTTVESPATPTCPSGSTVTISGGFTFDPNIDALIYSPCQINVGSGIQFYGQLFGGTTTVDGAARLFYSAVGLPGFDLSTGLQSTTATATNSWSAVSIRNLGG